ncbi:hypothetical protein HKD37_03G007931 [Glycine soja]
MFESSTLLQSRKPMSLGPHSSPEQAPVSFQLTIMFFLGFSFTTTPRGIPPASCRPGWWPQPPAPRRISGTRWPSGDVAGTTLRAGVDGRLDCRHVVAEAVSGGAEVGDGERVGIGVTWREGKIRGTWLHFWILTLYAPLPTLLS